MMFSDLPWDLESEILSRVPPTSLSTLRSTCKRWYALFKDPKFIKKNLSKAASQQVILRKDRKVYSVRIELNNNFDPSIGFKGKLTSLENSEYVEVYQISQCDGLLLCTTYENRLVVLNPCTGQTRWIRPYSHRTCYYDRYLLGYKNNNKSFRSYKILRLNNDRNPSGAKLYEFNSDSWKDLDDFTPNFSLDSNGVTLEGNIYWVAYHDKVDFLLKFILMFDFTTERFGHLSLPFQSDDNDDDDVVLSVVRDEKLALLHHKFDQYFDVDDSLKMKIWVTNTKNIDEAKDLSWSNFLVVDFGKFMITDISHVMSFLVDEEKNMVVCSVFTKNEKTRIYIVGEEMHKQVYEENLYDYLQILSYFPSLIQIPAR